MNTVLGTEFSQKALLNRIFYFTVGREAVLMLRKQETGKHCAITDRRQRQGELEEDMDMIQQYRDAGCRNTKNLQVKW